MINKEDISLFQSDNFKLFKYDEVQYDNFLINFSFLYKETHEVLYTIIIHNSYGTEPVKKIEVWVQGFYHCDEMKEEIHQISKFIKDFFLLGHKYRIEALFNENFFSISNSTKHSLIPIPYLENASWTESGVLYLQSLGKTNKEIPEILNLYDAEFRNVLYCINQKKEG
jgi:hypothetical protein